MARAWLKRRSNRRRRAMTRERWARLKALFHGALEQPADARARLAARRPCGRRRSCCSEARGAPRRRTTPPATSSKQPPQRRSRRSSTRSTPGTAARRRTASIERDRPRRHGRRLPGRRPAARPARRAQGAAAVRSRSDPTLRERLRREARAAATISHPAVATVYALEEIDGHLFIVSEYVRGRHAARRARAAARSTDRARAGHRHARSPARSAAAHDAGVIHRDLKPENVLITADGARQGRRLRHRARRGRGGHAADPRRRDARHAGLHGARAARRRHASTPARTSTPFGVVLAEMVDRASSAELAGATQRADRRSRPSSQRCVQHDPTATLRLGDASSLRALEGRRATPVPHATVSRTRWWWEFHQAHGRARSTG